MALKVSERRVVYLLAAIEALGDLRHLGLVDALEQVQSNMSPRQARLGHVVCVFNGISYRSVGVPAIDNSGTARVWKGYSQLACPTCGPDEFGIFNPKVNALVFDGHVVRILGQRFDDALYYGTR